MRRALRLSLILLACALPCAVTTAGARRSIMAPEQRSEFDEYFRKYAKHAFGVGTDWVWFKAQAVAESNLNPVARSQVRARGIMQLMPATYAELQRKHPDLGEIDEPRWNIAAGIYYDRQLWLRLAEMPSLEERRRFMFAAYNAGPSTIRRARSVARAAGQIDHEWRSISAIAPQVPQWRHRETLGYIEKIEAVQGRIKRN